MAQAIAAQKRTEKQYNDAVSEVSKWQHNAQFAVQKGDENLARQALERKKSANENSIALKTSLDQQVTQVDTLKKSMVQLESKITEYKNKKDMLRARITAAKAQEQIGSMVTNMNSNSAMAAFERMEEKVLMQEARAQSTAELAGADLDSQFARLEGSSDIDDELAALKASILSPAPTPKGELPPAESSSSSQKDKSKSPEPIDAELEELRKQLDKL